MMFVTGRRVSSMALCHKKERIRFGAVSLEGDYQLWRSRKESIMALCHKEEEYPLCRFVTRNSVSIMLHKEVVFLMGLCHKKKGIQYGTVSKVGESPLWRCDTRSRMFIMPLCHKKSILYGAVPQEVEYP